MKIVIFGATGVQGAAQVRAVQRLGHTPVCALRNPGAAEAIADKPAQGVYADLYKPETLAPVIAGADAVLMNLPSTSFQEAAPLIHAAEVIAKAAAATPSVKMLAFNTSLPVMDHPLGFASHDARLEMRRRIFAAGGRAVVLQPVVFLDNLVNAWAWPHIKEEGRLWYPHAPGLDVSWICHDDIASLMLATIERPQLSGKAIPIGGPQTVRGPVLAQILSDVWGRKLRFESQSIREFTASMARVFEGKASMAQQRLIDELGRIYAWYNSGPERPFYVDMEPVLKMLPVELTPIHVWARGKKLPG